MLKKPPIQKPLIGEGGLVSPEWALFFQQAWTGDTGEEWTPAFTGLTVVGTVTITGKIFQISRYLTYITVTITSVAGGTSASVAGTTYINNFPGNINNDGMIVNGRVTTGVGLGTAVVRASDNRIFTSNWTATTDTIIITGIIETR